MSGRVARYYCTNASCSGSSISSCSSSSTGAAAVWPAEPPEVKGYLGGAGLHRESCSSTPAAAVLSTVHPPPPLPSATASLHARGVWCEEGRRGGASGKEPLPATRPLLSSSGNAQPRRGGGAKGWGRPGRERGGGVGVRAMAPVVLETPHGLCVHHFEPEDSKVPDGRICSLVLRQVPGRLSTCNILTWVAYAVWCTETNFRTNRKRTNNVQDAPTPWINRLLAFS